MDKVKLQRIIGLVVLACIVCFSGIILQLAVNLVSIAAAIAILTAFWFLYPPFAYALNIGSRKIDNALTQANPIEALKIQLEAFDKYILEKEQMVIVATGSLANLKRLFNDNKNNFSPSKLQEWTDSISRHDVGIATAKEALSNLKKERESFRVEIKGAEADLAMASLSDGISGAINGANSPAISDRRTLALEAIASRVAQSQARVDLALEGIRPKELV